MRRIVLTFILAVQLVSIPLWTSNSFIVEAISNFPTNMPIVFVDPVNITASIGENFTISVKIFNLTNNFYIAGDSLPLPPSWDPGEPLPPADGRYNYSLGNLYGLDIQLRWDPEVLEYVDRVVKIPVETYTDGVLHEPIYDVKDDLDEEEGFYWLAKSSQNPAAAFNNPDSNSTVLEVTFNVKKLGTCVLNITSDLAVGIGLPQYKDAYRAIPHWTRSGTFQTPLLATRIRNLNVGTLVNNKFHNPIIYGENAIAQTNIINEGVSTDTFNLTLYINQNVFQTWVDKTLDPFEMKTFNYTIDSGYLSLGNYNITAYIESVSLERINQTDTITKVLVVIETPNLVINGPTSATVGDTIRYNAYNSSHNDPNGNILNYTWILTRIPESLPRIIQYGESITFYIDSDWPSGNWTVTLEVNDNYGMEYNEDRLATASYQKRQPLILLSLPTPIKISYISPSSGSPGTFIFIGGGQATSYGAVEIYFDNINVANTTANDWGDWSVSFMVPQVSAGTHTIEALDIISNTFEIAIFNVFQSPILHVSPLEAPIGSKITIFGENFQPNMGIYIAFEDLIFFSMINIDGEGKFNVTLTVPVVNTGSYTIKIIGISYYYPDGFQTYAQANFRVTKGLDTLFEELEEIKEALNQIKTKDNCNYNYSNYNYNYNYNYNCNCSNPLDNEDLTSGQENVNEPNIIANPSIDENDSNELSSDEKLDLGYIETLVFEAKIYALIAILIAVILGILTVFVLSKKR